MGKIYSYLIPLIIGVLALIPSDLFGIEIQPTGFSGKHFIGGRFGVWTGNSNEIAYDINGDSMEISGSSVYAEFFYAHRVSAPLAVEISLGIFNRGDFKYYANQDLLVGGVNIYPIMLSAKIYPLCMVNSIPLHPYLQAGGGLIYAKQDAISYYYNVVLTNDSETKFTYIFGTGIDWPLFDQIALCLNYKYIPAKFKNEMAGIRDYSGWQISFGAGYLFGSKRK